MRRPQTRSESRVMAVADRVVTFLVRPALPGTWSHVSFGVLAACLSVLCLVDLSAHPGVDLAVLYVIPPLVGAIVVGVVPGLALAGLGAATWAIAEPGGSVAVPSLTVHALDALIRFLGEALAVLLVDALRRTMRQAIASDRRARDFLGVAAYHMREPVAALRASAESFLSLGGTVEQEDFRQDIAIEAARIGRLLNNLMWVARLDGGAEYPVRRCDPVAACRAVIDRAGRHSPVVIELSSAGRGEVEVAEDVLRETVANLLDNALRHARRRISVDIGVRRRKLIVTVSDDGPGVPAGAEEDIFRRFVSLDGGTGLGLALCRDAARRMGGDLRYSAGSFSLSLPVDPGASRAGSAPTIDLTAGASIRAVERIQPS